VNTHSEYRRHGYQPPEPPAPQPEAVASELARHRDPSLSTAASTPLIAQKHLAWVRPTELASYAGPMVGRGIDLHTELVRRARRAPITTARAMRHPAPPTPPTAANRTEGPQL
jgi:hypothetical protein